MIAKRIPRLGHSSFRRLAQYLARGEPGEQVVALRITNCASDTPEEAVLEVMHLQNLNTRAKGDKTYHLVISFPPGERPSPDQMHEIEGELIGAIGLGEHQRMSAVHTDTEHLHVHIAVNKVHPETLRCIEPYYDKKKLFDACRQLEQRLGLEPLKLRDRDSNAPTLPGSTASMEIHAGIESFARHAAERVAARWPAIATVATWEQLHELLAEDGLVLRQRGAGLVLADPSGRFVVKASTANRGMSLGKLQKRLGPWKAGPEIKTKAPTAKPVQRGEKATDLFARFTAQRNAVQAARHKGRTAVQVEQKAHMSALYAWRDRRRLAIRQSRDLSPAMKVYAYSQLRVEFGVQLATSREQCGQRRARLLEANPLPSWQPWLVDRAGQGDAEALQVLGAREHRIQKRVSALLRASDADAVRQILNPVMKQGRVLRDGSVAYDPGDGGRIYDTAEGVQLRGQGAAAAWLALELASKRYAGQALTISGDIALRLQLAELVALRGLKITFADADLEQRRREQAARSSASRGTATKLAKDQSEHAVGRAKTIGPER